jgi:hypothetical protein
VDNSHHKRLVVGTINACSQSCNDIDVGVVCCDVVIVVCVVVFFLCPGVR